jgi:cell surface protein SprA
MNVPEGSVTVTAGGRNLTENVDYTVDYNLGRVTILNQSLLESTTPISISLENNSMFDIGTKSLLGNRFDYRISDNFNIGATVMHLHQKPLTNKVNIGNEPISNTIWGTDINLNQEVPFLTKFVDKFVPFIKTKTPSYIDFSGEFAHLIPGHPKILGEEGYTHIDDFEGSKVTIDLKTPSNWKIASTPQGQEDLFPEAKLSNDLKYGFNRAKIAWYNVNRDFQNSSVTPDYITNDDLSDHYVREIPEQEIFPDRDPQNDVPQFLYVLNLAYYPAERGPYNFDTESTEFSAGINEDGLLNEPETRWAGITRAITTNDFEEANIEFIEFWVLDPFIKNKDHEGGSLYLNLGNISEDILRDSRQSFENGLPAEGGTENLDSTVWGYVPILPRITEAFSTENDNALANQDVGLDGLSNSGESRKFRDYLTAINSIVKPELRDEFINDPSNDDYLFYFDPRYDALQKGILERYKRYNNQEGNSTTDNIDGNTISATELRPDMEDINRDYTLTENESYFQYKINISPGTMSVENNKYITGIRESYVTLRNEDEDTVKWYHFKIPLEDYEKAVGPIQDFKSIRFMRLFMKDWKEEVVLRFAEMDLVRGDWRKYRLSLLEGTEGIGGNEITDASLEINIVNIEENSSREPVNYVLPPGVTREISPNNPYLRQLNEQALSLKVINLSDGDARAAYKNASIDLRQFKRIQMFIHAEAIEGEDILNDDDLVAFVRLGSDFQENYYEYEIPLKLTPGDKFYNNGNKDEPDRLIVWPKENMLDLEFEELQRVKQSRNDKILKNEGNIKLTSRYSEDIDETGRRISIIGSPNLSNVRTIMIGIKNRKKQNNNLADDGLPKSVEVWVNELRLAGFDEKGGWATRGRMQVNLADFSTLAIAGEFSTPGFGSIEKSVSERQQSTDYSYDFSSSTEVGRFFPQKYGVRIPVYFGYSEVFSNPEYDPLNPDIKMTTVLKNMSQKERNDYLKLTQDYLRRKSFNVTNIRISGNSEKKKSKEGGGDRRKNIGGGKPLWHISNWSVSYGFNESYLSNINTEFDVLRIHTGAIAYNYNVSPKNVKPFSKVKLFRRKMFKLMRDFNFYYAPSMLAFRTDLRKSYNEIQLRNINDSTYTLPASYDKQFTWNRSYDIHYNLTRGLKFTYTINNQSWVDEPDGKIDKNIPEYDQYRDSVLNNLKSLGRTTDYHQGFTAVWDVPIDKLPLLGWTNVNARYSGDYFWTYVPEAYDEEDNPIPLGNTLRNKQNIQITSQFNLERVYTKVKYLKQIDNQFKGKKKPDKKKFKDVSFTKDNVKLKKGKAKSVTHNLDLEDVKVEVVDKSGQKIEGEIDISSSNRIRFTADKDYDDVKFTISGKKEEKENVLKIISDYTLYTLMSVRNLSLSYTSNAGTLVPGYLKDPSLFSFDDFTGEPGWEFILGMQQKQLEAIQFFQDGKKREWLSADTFLNEPVVFTSDIRWDFKATLKPFSGLRIDVSANRNESSTEQQLWAGNTDSDEDGRHEPNSIFTTGNFSMSILTIKTAFPGIIKSERDAFDQFLYNIFEIANSLADERSEENPNYNRNLLNKPRAVDDTVNTYPFGYSPTSKEVMLQAFLAAYTGFDNKYGRNPFPQIPLPNWRIKYDGLTYFELVRKAFKKVIINHNYTSNYRVANYTEDEDFIDLLYDQGSYFSGHIDEEGYFLPKYQIEGVSIDEKFIPLIGVDLDWNNDMSTRFEYKKTRTMTLSFTDDKLLETSRIEYMFGFGYKIPDLEVPINQRLFTSDLNFRFDFSYIDMITNIRRISADDIQPAAGNKSFSIKVKADYNLDKIMLSVFYDRIMNQPRVSTSFRTVNTHIGFSLRFNLANI